MLIRQSNYTISDIRDMLERKDLVVNRTYQRGSSLWPQSAKGYFIDTILENFPFPKIYIFQEVDGETLRPRREIVDGQQRITAIMEFINNEFRLGAVSKKYQGMYFGDMEQDVKARFLGYSVAVDLILEARRPEILEMFRRMNSYTLPLNASEKRHAAYQGEFKWFVAELLDDYSPLLSEFGVFSQKQLLRMADADLVAEVINTIGMGIVSASDKHLQKLYKDYDREFPLRERYEGIVRECFTFIRDNLGDMRSSFLMKPYAFFSLFCALIHNKYGLPDGERQIGFPHIGRFAVNIDVAKRQLYMLATAHENDEVQGPFREYVIACSEGTNRINQRITRTAYLCKALRGALV